MTRLEHLRELSTRLKGLLNDPHEGLMAWNDAVARVLKELAAYAPLDTEPVFTEWQPIDTASRSGVRNRMLLIDGTECIGSWWPFDGWRTPSGTPIVPVKWKPIRNTRTDADVEDDLRGIREDTGEM